MKEATIAREVAKTIGKMLRDNGVVVNITECTCDDVTETSFSRKYGASITGLDFSEHDKVFEYALSELGHAVSVLEGKIDTLRKRCNDSARDLFDRECYGALTIVCHSKETELENKQLKKRIAELESKEIVELPFDALETANYLINATCEVKSDGLAKVIVGTDKISRDRYSIDELEQIADHLLVYCKHNRKQE